MIKKTEKFDNHVFYLKKIINFNILKKYVILL